MRKESLIGEARKCRTWAQHFYDRPEQGFLLKAAHAFEELAREGGSKQQQR